MMATMIPWAPIIAFMVASPLSSPEGLIYSAGIFGWPFAIAFFVSSILLGFAGGIAAIFFESRGMLKNQTRFTAQVASASVVYKEQVQPLSTSAILRLLCRSSSNTNLWLLDLPSPTTEYNLSCGCDSVTSTVCS